MNLADSNNLLLDTLQLAVPLRIMEMSRWPEEARVEAGRAAADVVTAHGDALQFRGRNSAGRRETREAFAALTRGLAALAYQPGGVTFAGHHWCTDHAKCKAADAAAKANLAAIVLPPGEPKIETLTVTGGVL